MAEFNVVLKDDKGPHGRRSGEPNPSQCTSKDHDKKHTK